MAPWAYTYIHAYICTYMYAFIYYIRVQQIHTYIKKTYLRLSYDNNQAKNYDMPRVQAIPLEWTLKLNKGLKKIVGNLEYILSYLFNYIHI